MNIKAIIADRFSRWRKHLLNNNATPIVTIGVTHGKDSGRIVLCTTEKQGGMSNAEVAAILAQAAQQMLNDPNL